MQRAGHPRILSVILSGALSLAVMGPSRAAVPAAPAAGAAPPTLITNPSLETDAANWSAPFGPANRGERDTTRAYAGKASFKATRTTRYGDERIARYLPEALPAGTYAASVWVYVQDAAIGRVSIVPEVMNGAETVKSVTNSGGVTGRWVPVRTVFTVTTAGRFCLNFFGGQGQVGSIYLDALELQPEASVPAGKVAGQ